LKKAKKARDERIVRVTAWEKFIPALDEKKLILATWCNTTKCEEDVKMKTKEEKKEEKREEKEDGEIYEPISGAAKTLCIPFDQPELEKGTKCFHCDQSAQVWCLWGRSY